MVLTELRDYVDARRIKMRVELSVMALIKICLNAMFLNGEKDEKNVIKDVSNYHDL